MPTDHKILPLHIPDVPPSLLGDIEWFSGNFKSNIVRADTGVKEKIEGFTKCEIMLYTLIVLPPQFLEENLTAAEFLQEGKNSRLPTVPPNFCKIVNLKSL